jgi:hypothetical protein
MVSIGGAVVREGQIQCKNATQTDGINSLTINVWKKSSLFNHAQLTSIFGKGLNHDIQLISFFSVCKAQPFRL